MKSRFKTDGYLNFDQIPLNNAVLLAHRQYFHRLETFERVYEYLGRDLKKDGGIDEGDPGVGRGTFCLFRPMDEGAEAYCFLFPSMNSSTIDLATSSGY